MPVYFHHLSVVAVAARSCTTSMYTYFRRHAKRPSQDGFRQRQHARHGARERQDSGTEQVG